MCSSITDALARTRELGYFLALPAESISGYLLAAMEAVGEPGPGGIGFRQRLLTAGHNGAG
jgi:hypothetical protein